MKTSKLETVLAVDPGFDRMGLAILMKESGKEKVVFSSCISTDPKSSRGERLLMLGSSVREVIKKWRPDGLAIETLFFNKNISSGIGVAEARGVAIYEAAQADLKIFEYSPQAIKLALTGHGNATKAEVERMVRKIVSLPVKKRLDDELDAIALGITHLASTGSIWYK